MSNIEKFIINVSDIYHSLIENNNLKKVKLGEIIINELKKYPNNEKILNFYFHSLDGYLLENYLLKDNETNNIITDLIQNADFNIYNFISIIEKSIEESEKVIIDNNYIVKDNSINVDKILTTRHVDYYPVPFVRNNNFHFRKTYLKDVIGDEYKRMRYNLRQNFLNINNYKNFLNFKNVEKIASSIQFSKYIVNNQEYFYHVSGDGNHRTFICKIFKFLDENFAINNNFSLDSIHMIDTNILKKNFINNIEKHYNLDYSNKKKEENFLNKFFKRFKI